MDAEKIILEQLKEAESKAKCQANDAAVKKIIENTFSILNNATVSHFSRKENKNHFSYYAS